MWHFDVPRSYEIRIQDLKYRDLLERLRSDVWKLSTEVEVAAGTTPEAIQQLFAAAVTTILTNSGAQLHSSRDPRDEMPLFCFLRPGVNRGGILGGTSGRGGRIWSRDCTLESQEGWTITKLDAAAKRFAKIKERVCELPVIFAGWFVLCLPLCMILRNFLFSSTIWTYCHQ